MDSTPPSDAPESVHYDDMQNQMQEMVKVKIEQEKEMIKEEQKEQNKKEIKAMARKDPDFSLGWTISDTRCYMITLQISLVILCVILLITTNAQMGLEFDNQCDSINQSFGPYSSTNGAGCSWPFINNAVRMIGPVSGIISGIITIILSFWLGSKISKDMELNNDERTKVQKLEYFDLYTFCIFKFMRYVIGYLAYLQFISFGMDVCSYLIGREYVTSVLDETNDGMEFLVILYFSLPVAILLRISHDSMYQRVYKHKLKFNINADKGYAGATVVAANAAKIVEMGDTHHLAPSVYSDLAPSVHTQNLQYLQQTNMQATAPSVYSDIAPSVHSQSMHHVNNQTVIQHLNNPSMHHVNNQSVNHINNQSVNHINNQLTVASVQNHNIAQSQATN